MKSQPNEDQLSNLIIQHNHLQSEYDIVLLELKKKDAQLVNSNAKINHLQKKVNFLSAHSDALSKMLEATYKSVS